MKRMLLTLAAIAVVASLALAQSSGAPQTSTPPAGTSNQAQAPARKAPPQAKSKEEYDAYVKVAIAADGAAAEAAAREFEAQFPDSELKSLAYQATMQKYQQANNAEKTIDMGRKVLQYDPSNVYALVLTASVLSQRTLETDIDRDQKLKEATSNAETALRIAEAPDFQANPKATPEQNQAIKDRVTAWAHDAIGQAERLKRNDAAAEQQFQQALTTKWGQQDALVWLHLAMAQDRLGKYVDALKAADRAVALSANNPDLSRLAQTEQKRLSQLVTSGASSAGNKASVPTAPEPEVAKPK